MIHGGPFANIAHGCNSILATKMAMKLADYVVTEAGFGADLGAEKFFDIKCAKAGLKPKIVVLVATIRALKYHGEVWAKGGKGGEKLAQMVVDTIAENKANFTPLYSLDEPIKDKIKKIVTEIYRAKDIEYTQESEDSLQKIESLGYGHLPICISKTQKSFSDKAKLKGCPRDFTFNISDIRVSAGAGYIVVMSGTIIDMPGLSRNPAMEQIIIEDNGHIQGLF